MEAPDAGADAAAPTEPARGGGADTIHRDGLQPAPGCNPSACATACAVQPGVAGGNCVGSACLCDAPTCGQNLQPPCAGHSCSQGHYDTASNLCDNCGVDGAWCCDRAAPGTTTSCYDGSFCQNGTTCGLCGAEGQEACLPAQGDAFCDSGLVVALYKGSPTCASSCGSVGELPCESGGCTEQDSVLGGSSPDCVWTPNCGHQNQPCCDQGSEFQGGNCHDGSICRYEADFPGTGSWWCRNPCGCYPTDEPLPASPIGGVP